MNCIIINDEPIVRQAIKTLIEKTQNLVLLDSFNNDFDASKFMQNHVVDLAFFDILMSGINGVEFAKTIPQETFVIFYNSLSVFDVKNSKVDAIDYLVKPIKSERFQRGIAKAEVYFRLLKNDNINTIRQVTDDYFVI
jgi:two-component SAPR family response regulator